MQPIVIDNNEDDGDDDKDDVDDDNDSNVKEMYIDADLTQNVSFHKELSILETPEHSPISVNSSKEFMSPEKQTASRDRCIAS